MKLFFSLFFCFIIFNISVIFAQTNVKCPNGEIKIGIAQSLTGSRATFGIATNQGYFLWAERINALGGIPIEGGRCPVSFIVYDNESNTTKTALLYEKLIVEDEVDFLFGPHTSSHGAPASEVAEKYGVPILMTSARDSIYTIDKSWTIGLSTPGSRYQTSMVLFAHLRGAKSVGWIAQNDSFQELACGGADELARDLGMEVTYGRMLPTDPTAEELKTILQEVKSSKPEAFLSCTYHAISVDLMRIKYDIDFNPKLYSQTVSVGSQQYEDELGDLVKFTSGPSQWIKTIRTTGDDVFDGSAQEFDRAYTERWGETPPYQAAIASAVGVLLQNSITLLGGYDDLPLLMTVMKGQRFTCFFGRVEMGPLGNNINRPMIGVQYDRNGELIAIAPEEYASDLGIYPMPTYDDQEYDDSWFQEDSQIAITVIAIFFIVVSFAIIGFIYFYRENQVIRAASPVFLMLVMLGSCLLYSSTLAWQLFPNDSSCKAIPWLLTLGFVLFFGGAVVRTWRISKIFSDSNDMKKVTVSDKQVAIALSILMVVPLVVLIVWTAVNPLYAELIEPDENRASESYTECSEDEDVSVWAYLGILVGYGLALTIAGIYFSFRTSNVDRLVFNESKELLFSIYNAVLIAVLVIALEAGDTSDREVLFVVRSLCIIFGTAVSVIAIIVPKFIGMSKGQTYATRSTSSHSSRGATTNLSTTASL